MAIALREPFAFVSKAVRRAETWSALICKSVLSSITANVTDAARTEEL